MTLKYCFYTIKLAFQSICEYGCQLLSPNTDNINFSLSEFETMGEANIYIFELVKREPVRIFRVGFVPLKNNFIIKY